MNLGVCRIKLRLPENQSLKGKRQVLKSIIARVRNQYNIAIAEVDDQQRIHDPLDRLLGLVDVQAGRQFRARNHPAIILGHCTGTNPCL